MSPESPLILLITDEQKEKILEWLRRDLHPSVIESAKAFGLYEKNKEKIEKWNEQVRRGEIPDEYWLNGSMGL